MNRLVQEIALRTNTTSWSDTHDLPTALCIGALYAAVIAALTAKTELTANSDGAYLLAAAFSLAHGQGFLGFEGDPLAYWPPLYSSLLAGLSVLGLDLRWAAWLVNALAAFGIMSAIALWLQMAVERKALLVLGLVACAVLHPLLEILSEVRTDGLFFAFCLLSVVGAAVYLRGDAKGFGYGITFAALSSITRYQGLALLGAWGLLILWQARSRTLRDTGRSLLLVIVAGMPLALWLIRNVVATGTITGMRPVPNSMGEYLAETVPRVAASVTSWFLREAIPLEVRVPVMLGLLALLTIGLVLVLRRDPRGSSARVATLALLGFAVSYFVFTLASSMASSAWGVPRYMAPLAPVVVLLAIVLLDRLASRLPLPLTASVSTAVAVLLLAVPLVRSFHLAARIQEGRPGFQYGDWYAAIGPEIRRFSFDGAVLSNHGGLVWAIAYTPERTIDRSTWRKWLEAGPDVARERLRARVIAPSPLLTGPVNRIYFVEVLKSDEDALFAADLAAAFHLVLMVKVADGAIWRLE